MLLQGLTSLLLGALLSSVAPVRAEEDRSSATHGVIALRTHSLSAPYLDSDLQSRWFDYGGDTIIRADRYVRLASDLPSQVGYIWSRVPLTATNWEVEIDFAIHGKGNLFGDGMGIFFTTEREKTGPVFGNQDRFNGLGIFIDTYKNNRPGVTFPYVMAMLGDGNEPYDKGNDGKRNELAGCSIRGVRNSAFATKMRITYFAEKSLKVEMLYKNEGEWSDCFEVPDVKLPGVTYLGITAETGELSDNFDIVSLETRNLYSKAKNNKEPTTGSPKGGRGGGGRKSKAKQKGTWTWFLLKFVLFGIVVTGAYVGWTMYRAHKRDRF